jgi:UDP-glucose 4-epimerase
MKILVTGGAGFVGSNLIQSLINENPDHKITSLDCYWTGKKENHVINKNVFYIEGYTWDISEIFKNEAFDIIYHFGEFSRIVESFNQLTFLSKSNLYGTSMILEYAKVNKTKVIYSASSSKFGNDGKDENLAPYSWMKSKMVELIKNYRLWFNLEFEICYFFNVYGPNQIYEGEYATVVAIFERQFLNHEKCTVVEPGTQVRDFTHVNDIVDGLMKARNVCKNEEWLLRAGCNMSIIDLADLFGEWEYIPERRGERMAAPTDIVRGDTLNDLKWEPKYNIEDWIKFVKLKRS